MILKVMTGNGFKIYGPFHEAEITNVPIEDVKENALHYDNEGPDPLCLPIDIVRAKCHEVGAPPKYRQAILADMNGDEFRVVRFDTAAYLCGDDGRTIERI